MVSDMFERPARFGSAEEMQKEFEQRAIQAMSEMEDQGIEAPGDYTVMNAEAFVDRNIDIDMTGAGEDWTEEEQAMLDAPKRDDAFLALTQDEKNELVANNPPIRDPENPLEGEGDTEYRDRIQDLATEQATGAGEAMAVTDVPIPEDVPSEDYEPSKMEQTARSMDGMRGHKIMPKGLEKKLPPLYSQDGKGMDATVHAKFFDPQGQATWHLTEYDPKTGDAFGHADMGFGEGEMGYFNVWEIGQTKGKMGLPMERDMYFEPKSLNDAIG